MAKTQSQGAPEAAGNRDSSLSSSSWGLGKWLNYGSSNSSMDARVDGVKKEDSSRNTAAPPLSQPQTNICEGGGSWLSLPAFIPPELQNITIHPGHFFLLSSLPFLRGAYRGYRRPLDDMVRRVLMKQRAIAQASKSQQQKEAQRQLANLAQAEDHVRKAVGSAVAGRALYVGTLGSIGCFGLATSFAFYATGCSTLSEALARTKSWAVSGRRGLDSVLGVTKDQRYDDDHPEVILTRDMTEEEELQFLSDTYLSDEVDWSEGEDRNASTREDDDSTNKVVESVK